MGVGELEVMLYGIAESTGQLIPWEKKGIIQLYQEQ